MFTALNKLGYNSYHGLVAATDPRSRADRHLACWREALNYKVHGIGKAYSPSDLDKILQYHSAVTDMPCINFSKELIERFPNAKVIFTHRDPQAWIKTTSPHSEIAFTSAWGIGHYSRHTMTKKRFLKYMSQYTAFIKSLVPTENILEFHPGDGWEPLCRFLGKQVPVDEPFPFANKGLSILDMVRFAIRREVVRFFKPYLMVLGILAVG
ncbi:hypothetical protein HYFRA_00002767, partial [Hymenoscyphus fraxineus]